MDARAQAIQENAIMADVQTTVAATVISDSDELADAFGSTEQRPKPNRTQLLNTSTRHHLERERHEEGDEW